jgi:arginase family enzyme
VYLHLDMDCFDPGEFPDALVLTPGGPSFASVKAMLRELGAAFHVAGCSFVEYVDRGGGSLGLLKGCRIPVGRGRERPDPVA